jgi:hypothetical protein
MQATTQRVALASLSGLAALSLALCGCSGAGDSESPRTPDANASANARTGSGGSGVETKFGNAPTSSGGDGAASGLAGTAALDPGPMTCAQGEANTSPVTPTVWLVLDGSGSMNEQFGGSSRWVALRAALMDPGGVVESLQHTVRFGMVLYSGPMDGAVAAECVQLVTVQPAIDNYSVLSAQYPAKELGGSTPTDKALDTVVTTLPVTNSDQVLDAEPDPIYVILATDGAPNDHCTDAGGIRGGRGNQFDPVVAQRVLDVVGRGVQMGMQMFVISLAGDDAQLAMHLQDVATATGTGKPPFTPASKDDLVATLQQIIGNASCQIRLDGSVAAGHECAGEVLLNGNMLTCGSTDGWMLTDPSTVQLAGTACSSFLQTDSMVHATFPCDAFSPD